MLVVAQRIEQVPAQIQGARAANDRILIPVSHHLNRFIRVPQNADWTSHHHPHFLLHSLFPRHNLLESPQAAQVAQPIAFIELKTAILSLHVHRFQHLRNGG